MVWIRMMMIAKTVKVYELKIVTDNKRKLIKAIKSNSWETEW